MIFERDMVFMLLRERRFTLMFAESDVIFDREIVAFRQCLATDIYV